MEDAIEEMTGQQRPDGTDAQAAVAMHADQVSVSAGTVRSLLAHQFPEFGDLPVVPVEASGTDNAVFRVGEELSARFPLVLGSQAGVRRRLLAEAGAARELLGRTRFATPRPIGTGEPGDGYPGPWSIQTWLPGTVATEQDPGRSTAFAHDLAAFIEDVRRIPVRGRTFTGVGRGGDLRAHDAWMTTCFRRSEGLLDVPRLRALWRELRDLPRTAPDVMTHGDLIPGNVLVAEGRLAGALDVGGLGPADPALDLVGAWHLLEDETRAVLRDDLACTDLEWRRGGAWALEQAMGLVWYYVESNPAMARTGRRTLERILREMG
jgi:aminoglycoside phosphotransferase (APT) family kinase protein